MTVSTSKFILSLILVATVSLGVQSQAEAFCGFYVSGSGAELFNNATNVVMMRHGQRTVLSMQNNYQGPTEDFAMVVPVPQVLQKKEVRTLRDGVFARLNAMSSPRLVEYHEANPCPSPLLGRISGIGMAKGAGGGGIGIRASTRPKAEKPKVVVRNQFTAGEYDISILESNDATALDAWLREHKYKIPKGADKALRPYIEQGMYFFVAKVNADKVRFDGGKARLSPLRFHYESQEFALPVRLGLLNSEGEQDLIVHTIGTTRYEAANRPNTTVPTNLEVRAGVRPKFGQFYYSLFGSLMAKNPRYVVTEYAWNPWIPVPGNRPGGKCDPCPPQKMMLSNSDFHALGGDVARIPPGRAVLTRLHTRYSAKTMQNDLIFATADPIRGGLGMPDAKGRLSTKVDREGGGRNQFQGRYAILNRWMGPVACPNPEFGDWTGRGASMVSREQASGSSVVHGKWKRAVLKRFLRSKVPALGL